jgi:hypothetical protein
MLFTPESRSKLRGRRVQWSEVEGWLVAWGMSLFYGT